LAKKDERWPPAKVKAMRKELLAGATLQEIADRESVSKQRISQVVGKLNRPEPQYQQKVAKLFKAGKSDEQIAAKLGISLSYVQYLRQQSNLWRYRGPARKWTPELILKKAQEWYKKYGYSPMPTDWSPWLARKYGHAERVKRFYKLGAPHVSTVYKHFPTWHEMLEQAGLPFNVAGRPGQWKK
jgi:predicted DNA-binding protein YlxM (UPF0122 family)